MTNINQKKVRISDISLGEFFYLHDYNGLLYMKKRERKDVVECTIVSSRKEMQGNIGSEMVISNNPEIIPVEKTVVEFRTLDDGDHFILLSEITPKKLRILKVKDAGLSSYIKAVFPEHNRSIANPDDNTEVILLPNL